tara:strand:- start:1785 stop:3425 length:1641 start_codon:yes stop_codon:yes gene_type:complete
MSSLFEKEYQIHKQLEPEVEVNPNPNPMGLDDTSLMGAVDRSDNAQWIDGELYRSRYKGPGERGWDWKDINDPSLRRHDFLNEQIQRFDDEKNKWVPYGKNKHQRNPMTTGGVESLMPTGPIDFALETLLTGVAESGGYEKELGVLSGLALGMQGARGAKALFSGVRKAPRFIDDEIGYQIGKWDYNQAAKRLQKDPLLKDIPFKEQTVHFRQSQNQKTIYDDFIGIEKKMEMSPTAWGTFYKTNIPKAKMAYRQPSLSMLLDRPFYENFSLFSPVKQRAWAYKLGKGGTAESVAAHEGTHYLQWWGAVPTKSGKMPPSPPKTSLEHYALQESYNKTRWENRVNKKLGLEEFNKEMPHKDYIHSSGLVSPEANVIHPSRTLLWQSSKGKSEWPVPASPSSHQTLDSEITLKKRKEKGVKGEMKNYNVKGGELYEPMGWRTGFERSWDGKETYFRSFRGPMEVEARLEQIVRDGVRYKQIPRYTGAPRKLTTTLGDNASVAYNQLKKYGYTDKELFSMIDQYSNLRKSLAGNPSSWDDYMPKHFREK